MDEYHEQFSADEKYPDFSDINTTVYARPPKKHGRELSAEGFNFVPNRASARTVTAAPRVIAQRPDRLRVEKMANSSVAINSSINTAGIIEEFGGINAFMFLVLLVLFTCCYMIYGLYAVNRELVKLRKLVKMLATKT